MKKEVYEVYICRYDNEIVYIGEGKLGRHRHCNSGGSHVVGLNELYFLGDRELFSIEVRIVDSKKEAKQMQDLLILKHKPKFNIVGLKDVSQKVGSLRSKFKLSVENNIKYSKFNTKEKERMVNSFHEILRYHTLGKIEEDGGLYLMNHLFYKRVGFEFLPTTLHSLATHKTGCYAHKELFKIIAKSYLEVYSESLEVRFLRSGKFVLPKWLNED